MSSILLQAPKRVGFRETVRTNIASALGDSPNTTDVNAVLRSKQLEAVIFGLANQDENSKEYRQLFKNGLVKLKGVSHQDLRSKILEGELLAGILRIFSVKEDQKQLVSEILSTFGDSDSPSPSQVPESSPSVISEAPAVVPSVSKPASPPSEAPNSSPRKEASEGHPVSHKPLKAKLPVRRELPIPPVVPPAEGSLPPSPVPVAPQSPVSPVPQVSAAQPSCDSTGARLEGRETQEPSAVSSRASREVPNIRAVGESRSSSTGGDLALKKALEALQKQRAQIRGLTRTSLTAVAPESLNVRKDIQQLIKLVSQKFEQLDFQSSFSHTNEVLESIQSSIFDLVRQSQTSQVISGPTAPSSPSMMGSPPPQGRSPRHLSPSLAGSPVQPPCPLPNKPCQAPASNWAPMAVQNPFATNEPPVKPPMVSFPKLKRPLTLRKPSSTPPAPVVQMEPEFLNQDPLSFFETFESKNQADGSVGNLF